MSVPLVSSERLPLEPSAANASSSANCASEVHIPLYCWPCCRSSVSGARSQLLRRLSGARCLRMERLRSESHRTDQQEHIEDNAWPRE